MSCRKIQIPYLDVNFDAVVIEDIQFTNYAYVQEGDLLFTVFTPKAVEDVFAETSGYIVSAIENGEEVVLGTIVAYICDHQQEAEQHISTLKKRPETSDITATKKAIKLAQEYDLDLHQIGKIGIITEKDVQQFLDQRLLHQEKLL